MKYLGDVRERFRRAPAFTITDLRVLLGRKGIGKEYLHLLVHNLLVKGELKRISRGAYTFRNESQVVGFGFRPFYYGLQEALSLRNLWEQETNPVVITPRKVRSGVRSFDGTNYVIKRISRSMFFGFETMKYADFWIPVSDIEKTLIDFVYFKQPLGMEASVELKRLADRKKLDGYLGRCPKWVGLRVRKIIR